MTHPHEHDDEAPAGQHHFDEFGRDNLHPSPVAPLPETSWIHNPVPGVTPMEDREDPAHAPAEPHPHPQAPPPALHPSAEPPTAPR